MGGPTAETRLRVIGGLQRRLSRCLQRALAAVEPDRTLVLTEYPTEPRPLWGWGEPTNQWIAKALQESMGPVEALAAEFGELLDWCQTIPAHASAPGELAWDNRMWGSIDAVMQVHALRTRRCATYLEVGSGYSTMFARKAIEDFDLPTRIVSVDPNPRAEIDDLCDEVIRRPFDTCVDEALSHLAPGDVFLFDGSHLATMGSDAAALFCGPLEDVPHDVLMGVDDIYLPDDYHPTWAGRFYGEQYLLAAWLLGGHRGWEIRLPGWHATDPERSDDLFADLWPTIGSWGGNRGSCFWLESVAGP